MSPRPSHRPAAFPPTPEALAREALVFHQGFHITDLLSTLDLSDAPSAGIEHSLGYVTKAPSKMTPVFVGSLATPERIRL